MSNGPAPVEGRTIAIQQALERIRQESETFEQRKRHENLWFYLRLVMGYVSIALLAAIMVIATYIIIDHNSFATETVTISTGALFVDVLGLLVAVWRIALNPDFITRLAPVTEVEAGASTSPDG